MAGYRHVPGVSDLQRRIGTLLGLDLASATEAVASAKILDLVGPAVGTPTAARPPTDKQIAYGRVLGLHVEDETRRVASAMIADVLLERNQEALARLQLKPADRVVRCHRAELDGQVHEWQQEYVVSSVGRDGRVYFKGTGCPSAWASQVTRIA